MPNWCENIMTITGPKEEVNRFFDSLYDENSNFRFFERFDPTPEELLDIAAPSDSGMDWYQWRIDNWGCKWDVSDFYLRDTINFEDSDGIIHECLLVNFSTPWSPPLQGLKKVSSMFKDVLFYIEYREPGMGFGGYVKFLNGIAIESQEVELMPNIDDFLENIESEYEYDLNNNKD